MQKIRHVLITFETSEILYSNLGEKSIHFLKTQKKCDYSHTSNNEQIVNCVTIVTHFFEFLKT